MRLTTGMKFEYRNMLQSAEDLFIHSFLFSPMPLRSSHRFRPPSALPPIQETNCVFQIYHSVHPNFVRFVHNLVRVVGDLLRLQ